MSEVMRTAAGAGAGARSWAGAMVAFAPEGRGMPGAAFAPGTGFAVADGAAAPAPTGCAWEGEAP